MPDIWMRAPDSSHSARFWCVHLAWLALVVGGALADDWRGAMPNGARIEVDRETHKAWRLEDGRRAPLWDGVHRLEDGSVVIVRDGVAVPSESMLGDWSEPSSEPTRLDESTAVCRELVARVCGEDGRCDQREPCRLARELLGMADEESRSGPEFRARGSSAEHCREALGNDFFVPCD